MFELDQLEVPRSPAEASLNAVNATGPANCGAPPLASEDP